MVGHPFPLFQRWQVRGRKDIDSIDSAHSFFLVEFINIAGR